MTTPDNLEVARMILDAESNMVTNLQSVTAKEVADLVRRIVELLVSQD